jgi:hypothetical protein
MGDPAGLTASIPGSSRKIVIWRKIGFVFLLKGIRVERRRPRAAMHTLELYGRPFEQNARMKRG